jgi:SAM-dependent methyltransferase
MRRDWDERARRDAFHYIASWRKDWDAGAFLASGQEDFAKLVRPVLERCGIRTGGRVMAELGCGAGRMTGEFARHYGRVIAADLSEEMLARARRLHGEQKNILWLRIAGSDLACLGSGSVEFVFSYLVLQHLPEEKLALAYIREMLRILRPGGAFLFQFNGCQAPTMNRRGRMVWHLVDALWAAGLPKASRGLAAFAGLDPSVAGKSWRGAALGASRVEETVRAGGGEVRELRDRESPMAWCCGVKKAHGD